MSAVSTASILPPVRPVQSRPQPLKIDDADRDVAFGALMVPYDIKNQYLNGETQEVTGCRFYAEGTNGYCEVEFGEYADVWEIDLRPDNYWNSWRGWTKVERIDL